METDTREITMQVTLKTGLPNRVGMPITRAQQRAYETWGSSEKEPKDGQCRICGSFMSKADAVDLFGKITYPGSCSKCQPLVDEHYSSLETKESESSVWASTCPLLFQEILNNPNPKSKIDWNAFAIVKDWDPKGLRGMYITGDSGLGKTSSIWALAKKLELDHRVVPEIVTSPILARNLSICAREMDASFVNRLSKAPVLIIDDFGKEKFTEAVTVGVYEIIDHRYNNALPIVMTSRYGSKDLQMRFDVSQDSNMGYDICRRIGEMVKRVEFKRK
jgi:hypothetical protein